MKDKLDRQPTRNWVFPQKPNIQTKPSMIFYDTIQISHSNYIE